MNYLKAVKDVGTDRRRQGAWPHMHKTPINDFYAKGQIRADGRMIHDMYLFQVKTPEESTKPWDYYKLVARGAGRPGLHDRGRVEVRPLEVTRR